MVILCEVRENVKTVTRMWHMKNRSFYILLLIIVVGVTITTCTSYFLGSSSETGTDKKIASSVMKEDGEAFLSADGEASSGGLSGAAGEERPERDRSGGEPELNQEERQSRKELVLEAGAADAGEGSGPVSSDEECYDKQKKLLVSGAEGADPAAGEEGDSEIAAFSAKAEDSLEVNAEASVLISPLETNASQSDSQKDETEKPSYYRNRLMELDVQIRKSRESQTSSGTNLNSNSQTQNSVSGELKLWDNELNVVYDEILSRLDEKQAGELVEEERQWMKERDRLASEAAKASSDDAQESVEYTASLAESTRLRAYELVNAYEYLLTD